MEPSNSSLDTTVLLSEASQGQDQSTEKRCLSLRNVLDVEEAKTQILFSLPMILTNVFYYAIALVSVMFAGHLGELDLAGATLANSWANVTGYAFMLGLSGALETLCGQGFGAKTYNMLGIYLQASCIISFLFSIIISILWFFTEPILIFFHQQPDIAKKADAYLKYQIPAVFAFGLIQNVLRFLQTQSIVMPLVLYSGLPLVLHFGIAYTLVYWSSLGLEGASMAVSISFWISFLLLITYVAFSNKFEHTWGGFSFESFGYIIPDLKLALPSAAMVCLEYWAFEILVLLAGLMPNSEITTSLVAMCVNTEAIAFNFTYGLSAAASTRVSNELGAEKPEKAKKAMAVTLQLVVLLALIVVLALVFGHDTWAGFFSDSPSIIEDFATMTPFLAISIAVDSFQSVLSGVARGLGWQHMVVVVNLASYYVVGMPIAAIAGFKFKLYAKGLWIGLICGLLSQFAILLVITFHRRWSKIDISAERDEENSVD
ncbi:hypothetical protein ES319_D13G172800v1 [Gossypium barbadense]|uniref:Protein DETOXIFICATION n=1 Tax=Gossypium barbadense TaxID=3634 RepID=A0A5J5NQR8_GOSBA|nr:hypothetical protein ES319_D13G172800v1 [Gossypium barbadense]